MSLLVDYDSQNIFAKILSGAIPSAKVYEDDRTFAFMDAFPQSKGHTLVIPKADACNLFDIAPGDLQTLIVQTQRVARAVRDALSPDGVRIMQFNGEAAGQTVYHIHFHILPMWDDQPLARHAGGMADINELNALAAQIRAKL
ncbi:HIT family protein [Asticcacaulis solisilvae]|uniref:HIT family protein n=1 Tax=Asticcacaulis solisilvae TaxID=1217274 RepID=UPI003FD8E2FE